RLGRPRGTNRGVNHVQDSWVYDLGHWNCVRAGIVGRGAGKYPRAIRAARDQGRPGRNKASCMFAITWAGRRNDVPAQLVLIGWRVRSNASRCTGVDAPLGSRVAPDPGPSAHAREGMPLLPVPFTLLAQALDRHHTLAIGGIEYDDAL